MPCDTPRLLGDDDWLTQVGRRLPATDEYVFPNRLRPLKDPPETDLSMLLGVISPVDARRHAFGATAMKPGRNAARRVRVGGLRSAGFRVEHTPRHPGSPLHVSVFWDGEDGWDDKVAVLLDDCCMGGEVHE